VPASLAYEEKVLNQILKKEAFTATKSFLGLSSFKLEAGELTKKTTGTEFTAKEPTSGNGWVRVEMDELEWTVTKAEGATGFTIYENKNAIKGAGGAGEFKKVTAGEVVTRTFAVCDAATNGNILAFGTLAVNITVNSAATLEIAVGALKIEVE
jgi:hypothetical protein